MKNILFVTANNHVPWGGSEELWSQTAAYIASKRILNVGAVVKKWNIEPDHIIKIKKAGGQVFYLHESHKTLLDKVRLKIKKNIFGQKNKLINKKFNIFDQFCPDLVVISLGNNLSGYEWMKACFEKNIPYVNIIQLATEHHWQGDNVIDAYVRGYSNALHNFFVSKHNLKLTAIQLAISLDNASVIRNPFKVSGDIISYPTVVDKFFLACPASFFPLHKGQDILLQVLSMKKWKERPVYLNLYGRGVNESSLQRLSELNGLDKVCFKGFTNDITKIWEENHAFVLASRMEGLPLALVEAMFSGRVSIVTNVGGIGECVTDGINGFIANAPTVELFDEALERAWLRREDWKGMGENAFEAIKHLVPGDPVAVFATKITDLINA